MLLLTLAPNNLLRRYLNLARLIMRLLSRRTYRAAPAGAALPLNWLENSLGYFEYNPAAGVALVPAGGNGVKMLVGMFELLFGTAEGDQLRDWCRARGWPLVGAAPPGCSGAKERGRIV